MGSLQSGKFRAWWYLWTAASVPVTTPTTMQFSSSNIFVMIVIATAIVEAMPADDMIVPEPSQLGNSDILRKVLAQMSELRSNYDQLRSNYDQLRSNYDQLRSDHGQLRSDYDQQ